MNSVSVLERYGVYLLVLFAVSRLLNQGVPLDLRRSSYVLGLCILGGTFGAVLS